MNTEIGFAMKSSRRSRKVRVLSILAVITLVFSIVTVTAQTSPVSAATKTKVTLTIDMGKNGSTCPALYFKKGSKETLCQAVSKWYIDGKKGDAPWGKSDSWFKSHKVKAVMTVKVPKGTYKVTLDNGKKKKTLCTNLKVSGKELKKTVKF